MVAITERHVNINVKFRFPIKHLIENLRCLIICWICHIFLFLKKIYAFHGCYLNNDQSESTPDLDIAGRGYLLDVNIFEIRY